MEFSDDSSLYVFSQTGALLYTNSNIEVIDQYVVDHFYEIEEHSGYNEYLEIEYSRYQVPLYKAEENNWTLFSLTPSVLEESLYQSTIIIIVICFILIFLAIVIAISISRSISKPISSLILVMRSVSKGNLSARAPEVKGREMKELYSYFNEMLERIDNLIKTNNENQEALLKSELSILQAQINPHFLYNTLNSIRWIAIINHQNQIKKLVDGLSVLLRGIFKIDGEFVTLKNEILILQSYIEVMKVRYRNFEVFFDIPESLYEMKVMKFMLQPLIENSIIHGFKDINRIGEIHIKAFIDVKDLIIQINDNGVGYDSTKVKMIMGGKDDSKEKLSHIGIYNVHKRIQLHFGDEYGIRIFENKPMGTKVELKVKAITD